jgi:hypothetical protein
VQDLHSLTTGLAAEFGDCIGCLGSML